MTPEPRPRRRLRFWLRPFWYLTLLAALLLLGAYLAVHVPPDRFWPFALLGMAYPYLLAVHLFLFLAWLLLRPKRALVPLAAVLIGWGHVSDTFRLWGRSSPRPHAGEAVKVMSWNVRLFDLYNWSNNRFTRDRILDVIGQEQADILCVQEFYHEETPRGFMWRDTLLEGFGYRDLHDVYIHRTRHGHNFGIATFSRLPMVARGEVDFAERSNNQCIWTDILLGRDTLRVYNAHLASIRFGDEDYRFVEELNTDTDRRALQRGGARIVRRLRDAFQRRREEVARIKAHMANSPHPVLYCGDLNDTPMSYSYHQLRKGLVDAFSRSGRGMGSTYIGRFPSFRIDHILHGPELVSWDMHTLPHELSDHRAITTRLAWAPGHGATPAADAGGNSVTEAGNH
jgi:endonuclease/exonuclease/phosphatase family metal-dependent hydrolase